MREINIAENEKNPRVCVLDASTYVGFCLLKKLLIRGYYVHAAVTKNGEKEILKKIAALERTEKGRLRMFSVDILDYHSILEALRLCCGLFCCLDNKNDEKMVDSEVRGAINVVEGCAQTQTIHKIVFTSSLTAAVWNPNISSQKDVDERSWSDPHFCTKFKLWYGLAKTLSEKAAWGLAMDRMLNMVCINAGLVTGPDVARLNPQPTLSYLQGAEQMYVNGVLATVDINFLVDVHIRAFEDSSTSGRYLCFDHIVNSEAEAVKLAKCLSPLISIPSRYEWQESEVQVERLRNKKLSKLIAY
ncbi:putative anthocyanidin reductase [Sesamum alatum]|uniref:Anthocyanidin reductase n=1 Tax=Sesamum alatum TaxID=300844 RepID=A0AAE2CRU9_9LAMI|nr:putative anthocyanidin reductase [Sesamum alatum]